METVPKTLVEVLNAMLKDNNQLTWHIHGVHDKVVMNIMWSNIKAVSSDQDAFLKNISLSSTVSNNHVSKKQT